MSDLRLVKKSTKPCKICTKKRGDKYRSERYGVEVHPACLGTCIKCRKPCTVDTVICAKCKAGLQELHKDADPAHIHRSTDMTDRARHARRSTLDD